MKGYYSRALSAARLRRCYEIAPPRIKCFLEAEIERVLERVSSATRLLDMGCGYGRAMLPLAQKAGSVVGIDTSLESLKLARELTGPLGNCSLCQMNAVKLGFRDGAFDLVICIQNGISAFGVNRRELIAEALRVTAPGGLTLFSSYSEGIWEERLAWFRLQAAAGLIGEIDEQATGQGVIVCKDGFRATTVGEAEFRALAAGQLAELRFIEVDGSSLFCELRPPG